MSSDIGSHIEYTKDGAFIAYDNGSWSSLPPEAETLVFDDLSAMLYDMVRNDITHFQPLILASNNHTLAIKKRWYCSG